MKIYDEQEETLVTNAAPPEPGAKPEVSVFLPVYNEEPNLLPLHAKLDEALKVLGRTAEIIYVDDGSSDGSLNVLREIARLDESRSRGCLETQLRSDRGDGRRHRRRARRRADSDGR